MRPPVSWCSNRDGTLRTVEASSADAPTAGHTRMPLGELQAQMMMYTMQTGLDVGAIGVQGALR